MFYFYSFGFGVLYGCFKKVLEMQRCVVVGGCVQYVEFFLKLFVFVYGWFRQNFRDRRCLEFIQFIFLMQGFQEGGGFFLYQKVCVYMVKEIGGAVFNWSRFRFVFLGFLLRVGQEFCFGVFVEFEGSWFLVGFAEFSFVKANTFLSEVSSSVI